MLDPTLRCAFEHVVVNAIVVIVCLTFFSLDNPVIWVLLIVVIVGSLVVQHFRVRRLRQRQAMEVDACEP